MVNENFLQMCLHNYIWLGSLAIHDSFLFCSTLCNQKVQLTILDRHAPCRFFLGIESLTLRPIIAIVISAEAEAGWDGQGRRENSSPGLSSGSLVAERPGSPKNFEDFHTGKNFFFASISYFRERKTDENWWNRWIALYSIY